MQVANKKRINETIIRSYMTEEDVLINQAILVPIMMEQPYFSKESVEKSAFKFQKIVNGPINDPRLFMTNDEAAISVMLQALVKRTFEDRITFNKLMPSIMMMTAYSHFYHKGELEENPYYKNIKFPDVQVGRYRLGHNYYMPYELAFDNIPFEDPSVYHGLPAICSFGYKFEYPTIEEGNKLWMSVTPSEINTMKEPIEKASGKVLVLGCGMGYYAYMVSEKEDVESVTIVEESPEVIELFTKYILPQFDHKDKIQVVQADAFDYLRDLEDGQFDYCFADLWLNSQDLVPWIKTKRLCKRFSKMKVLYWLDPVMVGGLLLQIKERLLREAIKNIRGAKALDDITAGAGFLGLSKEEMAEVDGLIDEICKKIRIQKPADIDRVLDPRRVEKLL